MPDLPVWEDLHPWRLLLLRVRMSRAKVDVTITITIIIIITLTRVDHASNCVEMGLSMIKWGEKYPYAFYVLLLQLFLWLLDWIKIWMIVQSFRCLGAFQDQLWEMENWFCTHFAILHIFQYPGSHFCTYLTFSHMIFLHMTIMKFYTYFASQSKL